MKPAITLKELLKPPFSYRSGGIIQDVKGRSLINIDDSILEGRDDNSLWFASKLQDFTAAALNEKWERDFGEPLLRWLKVEVNSEHVEGVYYICPECKSITDEHGKFNPCLSCGKRLLPPEGEQNG